MIQHTKEYADTIDPTELRVKECKVRAFSVSFLNLLGETRKPYFIAIPPEVMSALGREHLRPSDLLDLPRTDSSFWGVYINIVTDSTGEVVGIYIGSSIAHCTYVRITGCLGHHLENNRSLSRNSPRCEQSEHYQPTTTEIIQQALCRKFSVTFLKQRCSLLFSPLNTSPLLLLHIL